MLRNSSELWSHKKITENTYGSEAHSSGQVYHETPVRYIYEKWKCRRYIKRQKFENAYWR
jgi:hypothetical protein